MNHTNDPFCESFHDSSMLEQQRLLARHLYELVESAPASAVELLAQVPGKWKKDGLSAGYRLEDVTPEMITASFRLLIEKGLVKLAEGAYSLT